MGSGFLRRVARRAHVLLLARGVFALVLTALVCAQPAQAQDSAYAFTRTEGDDVVLVAVNFADVPARVAYRDLAPAGRWTDWFSKAAVELAGAGTIEIPANGWRVLVR